MPVPYSAATEAFAESKERRLDRIACGLNWKPSERRACHCGSFNVEQARCAPHGVDAMAFRCLDCGALWTE